MGQIIKSSEEFKVVVLITEAHVIPTDGGDDPNC